MDGRLTLGAACARARAQAPVHLDGWTGALLTAVRFAMACGLLSLTYSSGWGSGGYPPGQRSTQRRCTKLRPEAGSAAEHGSRVFEQKSQVQLIRG